MADAGDRGGLDRGGRVPARPDWPGGIHRGRRHRARPRRRRERGGEAHAVVNRPDGLRCDDARGRGREIGRDGPLYDAAGEGGHREHAERHHRLRDRRDLDLQQHVGRRAAGVPAAGAAAGGAGRRREPSRGRAEHQRRLVDRRRVAAVDAGGAVRRRRHRPAHRPRAFPQPPPVGPGDVARRGPRMPALRRRVRGALAAHPRPPSL